jgi:hypothetical protein
VKFVLQQRYLHGSRFVMGELPCSPTCGYVAAGLIGAVLKCKPNTATTVFTDGKFAFPEPYQASAWQ